MSNTQSTTAADFQRDVLDADRPVLVDFWAAWCAPCRAMEPALEALSDQRSDISVVKVNVDDEQSLAAQYKVRGIPNLVLFDAGRPIANHVGLASFDQLNQWIDDAFAPAA